MQITKENRKRRNAEVEYEIVWRKSFKGEELVRGTASPFTLLRNAVCLYVFESNIHNISVHDQTKPQCRE